MPARVTLGRMSHGWLGLDWGNVPAWFGATITSGSLLVAANSYRRSVRDKEREQASKVAAWVGKIDEVGVSQHLLRLRNSSDSPVFDVTVKFDDDNELYFAELPPETTTSHALPDSMPASGPPIVREFSVSVSTILLPIEVTRETVLNSPGPDVRFRDSLGRWWLRSGTGGLKRLTSRFSAHAYGVNLGFIRLRWNRTDAEEKNRFMVSWPPHILGAGEFQFVTPSEALNRMKRTFERRRPPDRVAPDKTPESLNRTHAEL
jgi:hypothetical protein